jgi:hypothetical protein
LAIIKCACIDDEDISPTKILSFIFLNKLILEPEIPPIDIFNDCFDNLFKYLEPLEKPI